MIEFVLDDAPPGRELEGAANDLARALAADGLAIVRDASGAYAYPNLPLHLRDGLRRYADDGVLPGGLLCAVLENDLAAAVFRLHPPLGIPVLRDVLWYVHNELPNACHGSTSAVAAWLDGRRDR